MNDKKDIFRLARSREKRTTKLRNIKYIKTHDNKALLKITKLMKDARATLINYQTYS